MVVGVLGNVDSIVAFIFFPTVGAELSYGVFAGWLNEDTVLLYLGYAVDYTVLTFNRRRDP